MSERMTSTVSLTGGRVSVTEWLRIIDGHRIKCTGKLPMGSPDCEPVPSLI